MNLGPYELDQIYTGDARELAKAIPDESVDLIFTDPVYQNIDDYRWLAETAARVLKSNSAALIFCGIGYLSKTLAVLNHGKLNYRWTLTCNYAMRKEFHGKLQVSMTMCLWMEKGHSIVLAPVGDSTTLPPIREARYKQISGASWDKHPKIINRYINGFCCDGGIILDPFTGLGSIPAYAKRTGRHYLAFEIDPDTAERARQRVQNTQPPLLIPEPEQLEIEAMT